MNFLAPPVPKSTIPDGFGLADSAQNFFDRIDALEEVTAVHPIWLQKHLDDSFTTIDELKDEMILSQTRSPIRSDSKSGTLKELAKKYEEERIVNNLPQWNPSYTPKRLWQLMIGVYYLITQVFRIPLIIILIYMIYNLYGNTTSHGYTSLLTLLILFLANHIYILFFDDEIFARAFYKGYKTKVTSGLYVHEDDEFCNSIVHGEGKLKAFLNRPETYPFGWFNGDFQTLLPVILHDTIDLGLPYIRRYVRNELDNESIAIDIILPSHPIAPTQQLSFNTTKPLTHQLYFDPSKPVIVLHHGLNGSSQVSHLQSQINYWNQRGSAVLALNVRGYGGSFIIRKLFVSGRLSDLELAIKIAHVGAGNNTLVNLEKLTRKDKMSLAEKQLVNFHSCFNSNQSPMDLSNHKSLKITPVCGTGFSLGGIIMASYCCRKGPLSGLTSCLSVCAIAERVHGRQTERDWDPILMHTVKDFVGKSEPLLYAAQYGEMTTNEWNKSSSDGVGRFLDLDQIMNAINIPQFDSQYSYKVHGANSYKGFGNDLSFARHCKLDNLITKLMIVHPENDPIVHIDNLYPAVQLLLADHKQDSAFVHQKKKYCSKPVKNLIIYVPKHGGHIGSYPCWDDKWNYLSEISYLWHNSVNEAMLKE